MDAQTIEKYLMENQPIGFLQQLGKALGQIVGLGDVSFAGNMKELGYPGPKTLMIRMPVRAKENVIGEYTIYINGTEDVSSLRYRGHHPLVPEKDFMRLGYTIKTGSYLDVHGYPTRRHRTDRWRKKIVFPGLRRL